MMNVYWINLYNSYYFFLYFKYNNISFQIINFCASFTFLINLKTELV